MKLSKFLEITVVSDDDSPKEKVTECIAEAVEIPYDRISPDTLKNLISEFVSREWGEIGDSSYTLDYKIGQVLQQLEKKKAKVVFDLKTLSSNIVVIEKVTW
jgi:uncharacterized protein YheU (UPF0270 family)